MITERLMDCEKAQILLAPYILGDLDNDPLRCGQLQVHLQDCPECTEMYEGFQATIGFVLENKAEFSQAFKKAREMEQENAVPVKSVEFVEKTSNRSIGLLVKISAIAACLIIGFGLFFAASQFKSPSNRSVPVASSQQQNPVKIELVGNGTTEIIPAGQIITASDELKTLRINGNRQMVLNIGTELSIEPYNLGCLVKLDQGEIYTEVEHDGKPFVVSTSHGRAVITGTTLNIKADGNTMDLAVIEGSVRFESEKGSVDVIGGYQSSIAAGLNPTMPVACDVMQIAKWAKRQEIKFVPLVISSNTDISELAELSLVHVPYCDLEDIDFDVWIDQRREWFEREFPWTKRLQALLTKDGIEVDTIDLLIESGDLWRLAWPEYSHQRILADDREIIQAIANQYDIEVDLLTSTSMVQGKRNSNLEAFERWLDEFDNKESSLALNTIHAATFLINTRSLAWHAVNADYIEVQEKQRVLDLLTEQVRIASDMLGDSNQLLLIDKKESICSRAQCDEHAKKIKDDITSLMEIQKELIRHEDEKNN